MATIGHMWWHTIVAVILVCVSKPAVGAPPGKPADTAAVEDSKKLVTNSIGMKLTLIPAGELLMNALACRSACRNADLPSGRGQSTGFRIAFKPPGE